MNIRNLLEANALAELWFAGAKDQVADALAAQMEPLAQSESQLSLFAQLEDLLSSDDYAELQGMLNDREVIDNI